MTFISFSDDESHQPVHTKLRFFVRKSILQMFKFAAHNESVEMESKEGIEALFLYATEGILVVDDAGIIIQINPSAEKLFGYAKDELPGKRIETLVPHRFAEQHAVHREKFNHSPHARSMG